MSRLNMPTQMSVERCTELLNAVIDYVAISCSVSEQISTLTSIGFSDTELVTYFGYSQHDIDNFNESEAGCYD